MRRDQTIGRIGNFLRQTVTILLIGPLLWLALPEPRARANDESLDPKLEATVHLKILAYDRALKKRSGGKLVIGVFYEKGAGSCRADAQIMARAFEDAGVSKSMKVQGMTPHVVLVPLDSDIAESFAKAGATVVYVLPELARDQARITRVATERKTPTLGRTRRQVEAGLAVGVVPRSGRPRIVINLRAAKATGMDLDARVLALGDVFR